MTLTESKTSSNSRVVSCLILAAVGVLVYILSSSVIWIADTVTYQFNFATQNRIQTLADVFQSQNAHYLVWNGRYVAHWLCQVLECFCSKWVFAALNAAIFVGLIILICRYCKSRLDNVGTLATVSLLTLLFCDTDYAPQVQISYIWMATLLVAYLILFKADIHIKSIIAYIGLFIFSLIVGDGHEAMNIGIGGALIIYTLVHKFRITASRWVMLIGFGIGGLFLCLSPANFGKVNGAAVPLLYSAIELLLGLRVTYVLIVVLLYKSIFCKFSLKEFYKGNALIINAAAILLAFNLMIGITTNRQLFGIELFSVILTVQALKNHRFNAVMLVAIAVLVLGLYALKYSEIKKAADTYDTILSKISATADDVMYIDFPEFSTLVQPTQVFRHGVFVEYLLSTAYTYLHNSDKIQVRSYKVYPLKAKEALKSPSGNQVIEYLPGEFMIIQDKAAPATFELHRRLNILGITKDLAPVEVKPDRMDLSTATHDIGYVPSSFPIIENVSVTVSR